jgi:threonine synthase
MIQQQILDYLKANCRGRANARNKTLIMTDLDIHDERLFREMVHRLRLSEVPILSRSKHPPGYYIAADEAEALEALQELNGRALDLHLVCKCIRKGLKQQFPDSQGKLDLVS